MAIRSKSAASGLKAQYAAESAELYPRDAASQSALPGAKQVEQAAPAASTKLEQKVDYKAEERRRIEGQVRMHCVIAALQSPAGPAFAPTEEAYLALIQKLADVAFAYTFKGEDK